MHQARFEVVTAGHHFLLTVLPFRHSRSIAALRTFCTAARQSSVTPADLEAVLFRCLNVLSSHTARVPSLVDRYLTNHDSADILERFTDCVEQAIRYEGIEDGAAQEAIRIIDEQYSNAACTPGSVAGQVGLRLSTLDARFKRSTGDTVTDRIRAMRLRAAAELLATTGKAIKEIWVQVGYNHHSNFDHHFKHLFHMSPKRYRESSLRPAAQHVFRERRLSHPNDGLASTNRANVLIIDDDEGTRLALGTWLRIKGHASSSAANGGAALAVLKDTSPDALLIDYHLPDMDGVQLLRAIRQHHHEPAPGVALFTADWDLLERAPEIAHLGGLIASKLCDLEQVNNLVLYLSSHPVTRSPADGAASTRLPLV